MKEERYLKVIQSYPVEKRSLIFGNPQTNSPKAKLVAYNVYFEYQGTIFECFLPQYLEQRSYKKVREPTLLERIFNKGKTLREYRDGRLTGKTIRLIFIPDEGDK